LLLAASKAAQCGASADQALLNEGLMQDEEYYRLLAEHVNAPFYDGKIPIEEAVDPAKAAWDGIAALQPNEAGLRYVVAPRGRSIRLLLRGAQAGLTPEGVAIASPQRFEASLIGAAKTKIVDTGAFALKVHDQTLCADVRISAGQVFAAIIAVGAILAFGLALQLLFFEGSESMGDHDSGSDDWWRVG
jgi:hypothetical protein